MRSARTVFVLSVLSSLCVLLPDAHAQDGDSEKLEFKYITLTVRERKPWGEDRAWVKVDAPWGKGLWGLIDDEGTFLYGPELTSVETHGDVALVYHSWDVFGRPAEDEKSRPYNALIDRDGIRLYVNTLGHYTRPIGVPTPSEEITFDSDLGCFKAHLGYIPTSLVAPELTATPGVDIGYMRYTDGESIVEPVRGETTFDKGGPTRDDPARVRTGLYRQGGRWGFLTGSWGLPSGAKHVDGEEEAWTIVRTECVYDRVIPIAWDDWQRKPRRQVWLARRDERWYRLVFSGEDTPTENQEVFWFDPALDWFDRSPGGGVRWARHDVHYEELASLEGVPRCFAARTSAGWGIVGADGTSLLPFGARTANEAWSTLLTRLEGAYPSSARAQSDTVQLRILLTNALLLANAQPPLTADAIVRELSSIEHNRLECGVELLADLGAAPDSAFAMAVGQQLRELPPVDDAAARIQTDTGEKTPPQAPYRFGDVVQVELERAATQRRLDAAWPTATLFEKKSLTLGFVHDMIALSVSPDSRGIEEDKAFRFQHVVAQCKRLRQEVPFTVYFDFLAQVQAYPDAVGNAVYAAPLTSEDRDLLAKLQATTEGTYGALPRNPVTDIPYRSMLQLEMHRRRHLHMLRHPIPAGVGMNELASFGVDPRDPSRVYSILGTTPTYARSGIELGRDDIARIFRLEPGIYHNYPVYPSDAPGFSLGVEYEKQCYALRAAPDDPVRWLSRAMAICHTVAIAGRCRSRSSFLYKGSETAPVQYTTLETGGPDERLCRTPVELWPIFRPRVVADIAHAEALNAPESELAVVRFNVLFNDRSYEAVSRGDISGQTPPDVLAEFRRLLGQGVPAWELEYVYEDGRTAWLMCDAYGREFTLLRNEEAKARREKIQREVAAMLRACEARENAERRRRAKEHEEKIRRYQENLAHQFQYFDTGANYSSHTDTMTEMFDAYSRIMSGQNFNDYVLSGNSNTWTLK